MAAAVRYAQQHREWRRQQSSWGRPHGHGDSGDDERSDATPPWFGPGGYGNPGGYSGPGAGEYGWHWRYGRRRHHGWWRTRRDPGPMRRAREDRMLGGVAGGVSRKLGIDPTMVRLGFVLASMASGLGVALYVLGWLLLPEQGEESSIAARAMSDWRGIAMALSFVPLLIVCLVVASAVGVSWIGTISTPLCIGAGGLVLIYRNVGDDERGLLRRVLRPFARLGLTGRGSWRVLALRVVLGVGVVAGGLALLIAGPNKAVLRPMVGVILVVAGAVVVFGPWWLNIVRDLVNERQARALAEERADIATRVHDSVLQTLALIQRRADQPQQVVRLARAQERELRSWLFGGQVPGSTGEEDDVLSAAIERIQREVEELHEVPVEAVVVGDCELDDDLRSLIEAGREATVNAAKWSGAPVVSLFVEVEPDEVAMFVRDRGIGFDAGLVASDRRGVAESIYGRMARHGGSAEVRSTPGSGTEVRLTMPRDDARRARARQA